MASLPSDFVVLGDQAGAELYASFAKIEEILPSVEDVSEVPLLAVARKDLRDAIDVLTKASLVLARNGEDGNELLTEFLICAQADALDNPNPAWLDEVANDRQLIDGLLERSGDLADDGLVSLGVMDDVRNGLIRAVDGIRRTLRKAGKTALDRSGLLFRPSWSLWEDALSTVCWDGSWATFSSISPCVVRSGKREKSSNPSPLDLMPRGGPENRWWFSDIAWAESSYSIY